MKKLSSPLVLALCAGCLVLGSTGGAIAGAKITGKQIKNESVTGKDVKNASLTANDIAAGVLAGQRGPAGPAGPAGAPGTPGTNGINGISGLTMTSTFSPLLPANDPNPSVSKSCAAGKKLVSAVGHWQSSVRPVVTIYDDSDTASVFAASNPNADWLVLTIVCATAI